MADIMDVDLSDFKLEGTLIIKRIRSVFAEEILMLPHTVCFFLDIICPDGKERTVRFQYCVNRTDEDGFHATLRCDDGWFVPFITEELSLWFKIKGEETMVYNKILPSDALFAQ